MASDNNLASAAEQPYDTLDLLKASFYEEFLSYKGKLNQTGFDLTVVGAIPMTEDQIEPYRSQYESWNISVSSSGGAYELELESKQTLQGEEFSGTETVHVFNIEGRWCLFPDDIIELFYTYYAAPFYSFVIAAREQNFDLYLKSLGYSNYANSFSEEFLSSLKEGFYSMADEIAERYGGFEVNGYIPATEEQLAQLRNAYETSYPGLFSITNAYVLNLVNVDGSEPPLEMETPVFVFENNGQWYLSAPSEISSATNFAPFTSEHVGETEAEEKTLEEEIERPFFDFLIALQTFDFDLFWDAFGFDYHVSSDSAEFREFLQNDFNSMAAYYSENAMKLDVSVIGYSVATQEQLGKITDSMEYSFPSLLPVTNAYALNVTFMTEDGQVQENDTPVLVFESMGSWYLVSGR